MRILFLGDIVARPGRDAVKKYLPDLKTRYKLDVIIANAENAAHGAGLTPKVCRDLYEQGVDCITTGNHVWDQKEIIPYIDGDAKLLRPFNAPDGTPGKGYHVHELDDGRKILIMNVMGQVFMHPTYDNPFTLTAAFLENYRLGHGVNAIFIDMHAEATSEKMAFAKYLDGRVSGVVGSHSHIPTADAHIMGKGTAYQSDAGMCGDYDSVIGVRPQGAIARFTSKMSLERFSPTDGDGTLCGTFIEIDDKTGLATKIEPIRCGGLLKDSMPDV